MRERRLRGFAGRLVNGRIARRVRVVDDSRGPRMLNGVRMDHLRFLDLRFADWETPLAWAVAREAVTLRLREVPP